MRRDHRIQVRDLAAPIDRVTVSYEASQRYFGGYAGNNTMVSAVCIPVGAP